VFCLQHRYNRNVTFNEDRMRDAASFLNRVKEVVVSVREVTQSQRPSGLSLADTGRVVPPCARPNSADLELLSYLRHTKARVVRALRTDFATDEAMAELHKLLKECSRTMSVSEGKCSPEALHVRGLLLVCPAHTPHTVLCRLSLSSSSRLVSSLSLVPWGYRVYVKLRHPRHSMSHHCCVRWWWCRHAATLSPTPSRTSE